MIVWLSRNWKTHNGWEQGFYWIAYNEQSKGVATSHSKEDLVRICKEQQWVIHGT